jgi:hydroxymethylpyrimidine/phosphomethylpyrimidine kinase
MIANVLTIAGVDPSGGAGIAADIKTFSALGAYGMCVVTALTAQNTRAVTGVDVVDPEFVSRQIDTVFADVRVDAVKIGMIATADIAHAVADALIRNNARHIVVDPVMVAKSGDSLLAAAAVDALRERLLPLAEVITPNLPEAAALLSAAEAATPEAMERAAEALLALGPQSVLLKGGHLPGDICTDVYRDAGSSERLSARRIATRNTHGTGCTLSSAIAALLPSRPRVEAIRQAKQYLTEAIRAADELDVGSGHGPVHHFHNMWEAHRR